MENLKNLTTDLINGILQVTVNRPDKMNALNKETVREIGKVIREVTDNSEIKAMLLTGAGDKAFVAGADISEISELSEVHGRKFSEEGQEIFAEIESSHKPVIAAINGFALGGGCELAMACHMRVATKNARFGQPEVTLGILPGYGGTQRLAQLVGRGKAMEMLMTGDMITAEEARQLGLVNHVVEDRKELMDKCHEILRKVLKKAPVAVGLVVDSVNAYYCDDRKGYQVEANAFGTLCRTEDFKEGTSAFLDKRQAEFKGR